MDVSRAPCVGGVPEGHTHRALKFLVPDVAASLFPLPFQFFQVVLQVQQQTRLGALFSKPRNPASLVKELPDDDHVVAEDILGHSHPINFDVRGEVLPASD